MFKGNPDSLMARALTRVFDLMLLNVLFIITSIPIITIGSSLAALHYVLLRMVRNEEGYIIRSYLKAFKDNFRQATVAWLVFVLLGALLFMDYRVLDDLPDNISRISGTLLVIVAVIYLCVFIYFFPFLARFENTLANTLKNVLVVAVVYFVRTILMAAVFVLFVLIYYNLPLRAAPVLLLFGITLPASIIAYIYTPILKKVEGL